MVSNEIFVIGLAIMFSYIVLYNLNKYIGGIGFILTGIALMSMDMDRNIYNAVGLLITLGGIISIIYNMVSGFDDKGAKNVKYRKR